MHVDDDDDDEFDDYDNDEDDDYDNDTVEEANDDDPLVVSGEDAEFNDNDGANDVEDNLSPSFKLFYRQFIQPLGGERIARGLVKPYLPQIFQLICKHHRFFDINGKDVAVPGIVLPKITNNGGVYVTVEKEPNADGLYTIITVGSTSNFKKRMEYTINVSTCTLLSLCILSFYLYHSITPLIVFIL